MATVTVQDPNEGPKRVAIALTTDDVRDLAAGNSVTITCDPRVTIAPAAALPADEVPEISAREMRERRAWALEKVGQYSLSSDSASALTIAEKIVQYIVNGPEEEASA